MLPILSLKLNVWLLTHVNQPSTHNIQGWEIIIAVNKDCHYQLYAFSFLFAQCESGQPCLSILLWWDYNPFPLLVSRSHWRCWNFGQEGYGRGALPPSSLADPILEGWHHCLHKSSLKFAGHAQKEILYCILLFLPECDLCFSQFHLFKIWKLYIGIFTILYIFYIYMYI